MSFTLWNFLMVPQERLHYILLYQPEWYQNNQASFIYITHNYERRNTVTLSIFILLFNCIHIYFKSTVSIRP